MEIKMSAIPTYGDLMTIEDFKECVDCGGFIDYDGFGNYATESQCSNIEVWPSDVKKGNLRSDFTHVVWYNR